MVAPTPPSKPVLAGATARTAPAPISDDVATLSARIAARTPTETALRRFADDLDDPSADLVVAALIGILAVLRIAFGAQA